ncbi:hypothetical protein [Streptomyces sp. 8K308]|uniref:hypothetical protein n=1 Tax=Streptomyces sp. 8K308 TaxID=2530388 RepID=UPI001FB575B8|nr:hypothetical protein [Streptomyces sp. 8K308]
MRLRRGQEGDRAHDVVRPPLRREGACQSVYGCPVEPGRVPHRVVDALVFLVQVEQRCEGLLQGG